MSYSLRGRVEIRAKRWQRALDVMGSHRGDVFVYELTVCVCVCVWVGQPFRWFVLLIKPLCEFEVEEMTWVGGVLDGWGGGSAGKRFWKLCAETHVQYASDATAAVPYYTIILLTTASPRCRKTLARCKRLRKLVALLLPSAWLMWFYHRRTSVCLAPPVEEAYRSGRTLFSSAWLLAAGPANLGKPVATSPTPDLVDGVSTRCWEKFPSTTLYVFMSVLLDSGKTFSTIFQVVLIIYLTIILSCPYNIIGIIILWKRILLSRARSVRQWHHWDMTQF